MNKCLNDVRASRCVKFETTYRHIWRSLECEDIPVTARNAAIYHDIVRAMLTGPKDVCHRSFLSSPVLKTDTFNHLDKEYRLNFSELRTIHKIPIAPLLIIIADMCPDQ